MESGDTRCAKCSLVILKELTMIMQDLLKKSNTSATHIYTIIKDDPEFGYHCLNDDQKKMVESLKTSGYDRLDISLAYKIANYYRTFFSPPSQGWGQEPDSDQTRVGDDVERIRLIRNRFVHLVNTDISVESFNNVFTQCIQIGKRVDKYLQIPSDTGYEHTISNYKNYTFDFALKRKHIDALVDIEQLKEKLQCEIGKLTVHVFIGRTIEQACEMITQTGVDGKINIKMTFHGIDDSEHNISVINSMKETFTTENISVKTVVQGCINVFIEVQKKVMVDEVMFESEICTFIRKFCNICKLTCIAQETANAVITTAEGDFECESERNTLEANSEADQAHEKFSTTLESFFKELAGKVNEENMIGKDDMEDELDPLATERSGLNSQNKVQQADKLSATYDDKISTDMTEHAFDCDFEDDSAIYASAEGNRSNIFGESKSIVDTYIKVDKSQEKFGSTFEGFSNDQAGKENGKNTGNNDNNDALLPYGNDDFHSKSRISNPEANSEVDQTGEKFSTTLEGFFNDLAGKRNENNIVGKDDMDDALVPLATGDFEDESAIYPSAECKRSNVFVERKFIGETNNKLAEISTKLASFECLLKGKAGKGMEKNIGKNDIKDSPIPHGTGDFKDESAIYVRAESNRSNVLGRKKSFVETYNQLDKISTKLTTMEGFLKGQAGKGMEKNKGKNDFNETLITHETGLKRKFDETVYNLKPIL